MRSYLLAAAALLPLVSVTPAQAQRPGDKIANSYICVFKGNVSRGGAQAELLEPGAETVDIEHHAHALLHLRNGRCSLAREDRGAVLARQNASVHKAKPDGLVERGHDLGEQRAVLEHHGRGRARERDYRDSGTSTLLAGCEKGTAGQELFCGGPLTTDSPRSTAPRSRRRRSAGSPTRWSRR